jgi:4-carboxymuconolactone decarboxylase
MQRAHAVSISIFLSSFIVLSPHLASGTDPTPDDAAQGRAMQERVYADIPPDDPWLKIGQEHLFGQIWTRPGLTMKERRLISLSVASALGSRLGFAAHLRGALESGDLTEDEIWEWLIHFTQYAGYPKAAPVWSEYRMLLAERGSMPLPSRGVDKPREQQPAEPAEKPR